MFHQAIDIYIWIVDIGHTAINNFAQIVCRHVCGHTYCDTRGTINQKRRDASRQDRRFIARVIVVTVHIYRFLLDILHHCFTNKAHLRLGVTHCCSTISIHRTEVALANDERVAHCPRLSHTHECTIYRTITVWMVFTQHFTYDSCRFLCRFIMSDTHIHHTVQNATMNGFETIANIRERTAYND